MPRMVINADLHCKCYQLHENSEFLTAVVSRILTNYLR